MSRNFYYIPVLTTLLSLFISIAGYTIAQPQLHLADDEFSLSIPDDADIKFVQFHVNINKEFETYWESQLSCDVQMPKDRRWSCSFDKALLDQDVVYTYILVQHDNVIYRSRKLPISVASVRRGDANPFAITFGKGTTEMPIPTPTPASTTEKCIPSISVVEGSDNSQLCQGHIIFEENFDRLDSERWTNEVRIPTTLLDSEFVIYNGSASVDNGILKLEAHTWDHGIGREYDFKERCTGVEDEECHYRPRLHHFLPPVISARINCAKSFNFKYGKIEIRAKMPIGDWLFPVLILQPSKELYGTDPFSNGELRIAFVRGNKELQCNGTDIGGTRLFGGAVFALEANERHKFMVNTTLRQAQVSEAKQEHFGEKFHIYTLAWKTAELIFSVDDREYGRIPIDFKESVNFPSWRFKDKHVPFDQMFYLSLGLAAGGHGDFPDHLLNKPWENANTKALIDFNGNRAEWLKTWKQPTLEIDYVRVYAI